MKSLLARLIRRLGSYVKNSPRARRLALGVLSRSPWLNVKCRRAYLGSQLGRSQAAAALGTVAADAAVPAALSGGGLADGINAGQRTPLEAHFHRYVERE